ncbi:D-2-hydroxyacid dehydrogenase [Peribacillus frigoritolerans]|uniref:D-2-hydroxyacid dehydrogenase n=1 Tax=Peribacillus frigoritolerans TaxID=450367 RepID=UPI001059A286|nr:D-2-hydroxyacid dehydrogenase [Peribacillus frigoritolerans]TDL77749.1 D-2-hydroxyacid dehydrogenase [Peribacillus frigoritolerans]
MKILSTVKLPSYLKEELVNEFPNLDFNFDNRINDVLNEVKEAEVILTYGEDLTADIVGQAIGLKWLMVASAGMDKLPFDALIQQNIMVTNSKGVHKIPMAEYTISMMLQISRESQQLYKNQQERKWDRSVKMHELHGKTIFILGAGAIGTEIARLAKAFGMKTEGMNRSGRTVEYFDGIHTYNGLEAGMRKADFVVSVLPSTKETKGLLNYKAFSWMKPEGIFINIGRGDAVCETDLVKALNEGKIKHAVLDVFEEEPLREDHSFWGMKNVTVTPHLSGITENYLPRAMDIFKRNLALYIDGDYSSMENIINLKQGY